MFNSLTIQKLYAQEELINLYEKTEMHVIVADEKVTSIKKRESPQ